MDLLTFLASGPTFSTAAVFQLPLKGGVLLSVLAVVSLYCLLTVCCRYCSDFQEDLSVSQTFILLKT